MIDFKRERPSLEDSLEDSLKVLADAAVCFANADGGSIVIGVADVPLPAGSSWTGISPSLTVEAVRRGIFDRTMPPQPVLAETVDRSGVVSSRRLFCDLLG